MCPKHTREWSSWLDYKLTPGPISLCTPGRSSVRDVMAARTARTQEWKDTITNAQTHIKEICGKGGNCGD